MMNTKGQTFTVILAAMLLLVGAVAMMENTEDASASATRSTAYDPYIVSMQINGSAFHNLNETVMPYEYTRLGEHHQGDYPTTLVVSHACLAGNVSIGNVTMGGDDFDLPGVTLTHYSIWISNSTSRLLGPNTTLVENNTLPSDISNGTYRLDIRVLLNTPAGPLVVYAYYNLIVCDYAIALNATMDGELVSFAGGNVTGGTRMLILPYYVGLTTDQGISHYWLPETVVDADSFTMLVWMAANYNRHIFVEGDYINTNYVSRYEHAGMGTLFYLPGFNGTSELQVMSKPGHWVEINDDLLFVPLQDIDVNLTAPWAPGASGTMHMHVSEPLNLTITVELGATLQTVVVTWTIEWGLHSLGFEMYADALLLTLRGYANYVSTYGTATFGTLSAAKRTDLAARLTGPILDTVLDTSEYRDATTMGLVRVNLKAYDTTDIAGGIITKDAEGNVSTSWYIEGETTEITANAEELAAQIWLPGFDVWDTTYVLVWPDNYRLTAPFYSLGPGVNLSTHDGQPLEGSLIFPVSSDSATSATVFLTRFTAPTPPVDDDDDDDDDDEPTTLAIPMWLWIVLLIGLVWFLFFRKRRRN